MFGDRVADSLHKLVRVLAGHLERVQDHLLDVALLPTETKNTPKIVADDFCWQVWKYR